MIRDIASRALQELDEHGWVQGSCADGQGRICMGTALCRAAGLPEDGRLTRFQLGLWMMITDSVKDAIGRLCGAPFDAANCVAKFNDFSSERDVRNILEDLRDAA